MVVHEAACSGLPLICSDVVGSAVHLLRDGYNGYSFESENEEQLSTCFERLSTLPKDRLSVMGDRSRELSKQFSEDLWSETLRRGFDALNV